MQTLLVAIVALITCACLWRAGPRGLVGISATALLSLLGVGTIVLTFWVQPVAEAAPVHRPLVKPADDYVGSATCRSCHPAEHASWHESFHRTMTQVARRDTVLAQFERLELDWFGKPVVLEWRGDELWVQFERGGKQPGPVLRPIEQLTGSHHLQVLWYSTGNQRELAPVPMCFKIAEGVWLPLTTVFVLPPEFRDPPDPGAWNQNCHMCHATGVRPRVDIDRCDTEASELGIACEACHGPGERHVTANRNPVRRYVQHLDEGGDKAGDKTVVLPQRLGPARSAQVCGQCHSVNILRSAHFDSWREHGLVYRPGGDLHASNLVIDPNHRYADELRRTLQHNPQFFASAFWSDGEVRLSGREYNGLVKSPCYTHGDADKQLDCTSCHELHGASHGVADGGDAADRDAWRDDQLKSGMRGNAACTQCHESLRDDAALAQHTHHAPGGGGSTCYDCHMPHTSFGLMKAERSHTITSPSVQTELQTGRPNACNLCHLDRTLQWTVERLQAWYGIEPSPLDDEQANVAAGARWLLTGDAGQRAVATWSFGWKEAQRAAGTDWMSPYLARLLDDPYYVVRFGAARSLRSLPGGVPELEGFDFVAEADAVRPFGERITARWREGYRGAPRPALLLEERGLAVEAFARLYARRNDRPVYLAE
ncbi:MAG: hypothetical protein H6838_09675 [Planctomycetes bacterium]|nr:hypothetical protein [Planctomycetota bacterium]